MTHTPGPWVVNEDDDGNYKSIGSANWWGLAQVVVRCEGEQNYDQTGLANARLIAAAPDLLFALQRLMDLIELSGPRRIAPHKSPIEAVRATLTKADYEAARAAIAKAEGRS